MRPSGWVVAGVEGENVFERYTEKARRVIFFARYEASQYGSPYIETEHLLLGLMREDKALANRFLRSHGSIESIRKEIEQRITIRERISTSVEVPLSQESKRILNFATEEAERLGHRHVGTEHVLLGEPGVGKTAIVEGLAQRISDSDVPPFLAEKRILSLDLSLIVAGTKYRGQFEERLKTIMKELMESQNSIVFIDELHTLVGAGSAEGSLDAANILKPALSRGEIQCIGATTPGEYRKSIEKDRSLERRFQAVKVPPPNEADAIKIIHGIKDRYEKFHAVSYTDAAIEFAVSHSNRYIPDRFLPDKAIAVSYTH